MTQPYAPLQGLTGFGGQPGALTGLPGFAPSPQAVQQPGGPVGLPTALQGTSAAQFDAAHPAPDVGIAETVATQTGRGMLDALLGSGALLGAGAEGLGNVTGWDGAKDFGRDLGRSANGAAAMEAAAFLFGKGAGGNKRGFDYADRTEHAIQKQEEAWPMLTTVSRIGGAAAFALATGGLSGATGGVGATLPGVIGMGAVEGGAAGVQEAYAKNEAYRDILISGVIGAGIGGVTAGTVHYGGHKLGEVFGHVQTAADDAVKAIRKAGADEAADAADAMLAHRATILRAVESAGENPGLKREAYKKAVQLAGDKLGIDGELDVSKWATAKVTPVQKLLNRGEMLDRISTDLADDVSRVTAARPAIDFALKVPKKLLADADATTAIGTLQTRVTQAIEQAPGAIKAQLLPLSERLAKADAAESMAIGHEMVVGLSKLGATAGDQVTASYAQRSAGALADELAGEAWGAAGKAYKSLSRLDSPLDALDAKAIRDALRVSSTDKALPTLFGEEAGQTEAAYAARKMLGGEGIDKASKAALRDAIKRVDKAHELMTFSGAPADVVMEMLSGAGKKAAIKGAKDLAVMGVGALIGGAPGALVAKTLMPVLEKVAGVAFDKVASKSGAAARGLGKVAHGASHESARQAGIWQQFTYHEQIEHLAKYVTGATPDVAEQHERSLEGVPPELQAQAGADMQQKLSQLMTDIPKPKPNIRGKAWEGLSAGDLRKAQAMWEATMQPMSVFGDFTAGNIDYDKVRYTWKQYPGLQQAAQAGLVDIIHTQLDDKQREGISDGMLTQLDNLFGFEGALQPTLDRSFASRMSALAQPDPQNQPPQSNGPLNLPGSKPSFTERIAGA